MRKGGFVGPLVVLYGGAFMAGFNENLVNMALVSLMAEFGVDSVTAQWLVTGYMIVATVVVMAMAFFFRRFKLRTLFFVAAGLTLVGSAAGLAAPSFTLTLAARLVQAAGSGVFIPLMMNAILVMVPKNRLGTFMSIGSCMITFGPALAPVVCGGLVTALGWRSIFAVPTVAMVVLLVAGAVLLRNLERSEAHLDAASVVLSALFLTGLSFGLAQLALDAAIAAAALAVAAASAVAFVVRQLRCAHPLIDLAPCRNIWFWPTLILAMIAMMTTFSLSVLLPLYLEGSMGYTAFVSGLIILVPVLGNAATSLLGGRIMDRWGEWPLIPAGFASIVVGLGLLAATSAAMSLPMTFVGALFAFAGVGAVFSPSQTAGLRRVPPEQNPFAVALSTTFVQVAACIGPSLYIGIMSGVQAGAVAGGASAQAGSAQGFAVAILVAAAIGFAGFVISLAYALAARRQAAAPASGTPSAPLQPSPAIAAIMEREPYTIRDNASMSQAMQAFVTLKVGGLPVVDAAGRGVGFLSDGDVMRYLADKHATVSSAYSLIEAANAQSMDERLHELAELPVSEVATGKLVAIDQGATLEDVCALLAQHRYKKLPVVQEGQVVGTVNRSDVLRFAMESFLKADEDKVKA